MANEQKDDKLGWPSDPKYYQWKGTISVRNGIWNVLAHCKRRKEDVFLKIKQTQDHDNDIDAFIENTKNLINIQHANLLTPIHAFVYKSEIWVIYPRHTGGPLIEVLTSHYPNGIPDEGIVASILYDTACGLHNLHKQQICHRNIRAASIHIDIDEGSALLTNFVELKEIKWKKADNRRNTMVSPERQPFTDPLILYGDESASWYMGDIYAFGITALQLTYGAPPPLNLANMIKNRGGGGMQAINTTISVNIYDKQCPFSKSFENLIKDCCSQKDRISINKLINHKFFQKKASKSSMTQYFGHILKSTEKRINPSLQAPVTFNLGNDNQSNDNSENVNDSNQPFMNGNNIQIMDANGHKLNNDNVNDLNAMHHHQNDENSMNQQPKKQPKQNVDDWSFSTRLSKSDLRKSAIIEVEEEEEPIPTSTSSQTITSPQNQYNDPTNLHKLSTNNNNTNSDEKIEALPKTRKYHVSFSESAESMSLMDHENSLNTPNNVSNNNGQQGAVQQINRFKVEYTELSATNTSRLSTTETEIFDPESPQPDESEDEEPHNDDSKGNDDEEEDEEEEEEVDEHNTKQIKRFIISPAPPEHIPIESTPEPKKIKKVNKNANNTAQKNETRSEENKKWIAPKEAKSKWNESDCSQWVGSLGEKYKQYIDVFVENGVDGDLLCAVNDEELKDIISSGLHRKKILSAWNKLQTND